MPDFCEESTAVHEVTARSHFRPLRAGLKTSENIGFHSAQKNRFDNLAACLCLPVPLGRQAEGRQV